MKYCWNPQNSWEKLSSFLVGKIENGFYELGLRVALHPWKTIIITFLFVLTTSVGFLNFYHEKNPMKLWVPPDSDFFKDTEWYIDKFNTGVRKQMVMVTANDVLQPKVLEQLHYITNEIHKIKVNVDNRTYSFVNFCLTVPKINNNFVSERQKRSIGSKEVASEFGDLSFSNIFSESDDEEESMDLSAKLNSAAYHSVYCRIFNSFNSTCYQQNILDIWNYNRTVISNLTKSEIVRKINKTSISPDSGHPVDFSRLLGQVTRDEHGTIVKAGSVIMIWHALVNFTAIDINEVGNLVGTEDWVSKELLAWEQAFLELMEGLASNFSDINIYYQAGRSYADISGETMFQELDKLFIGIALMFVYIQIVMAGFNWLELRLTLGSVGLLCVGMAYIVACSLCSAIGIPYGPVHASLPFLLMGLGIDDMFVMKACWEELNDEENTKPSPEKIGIMLKHAGVSIVITSFTDIVAFLIGSITILPSLKSFCYYAAMGVFFIFCFSVTFYVAVMSLDERRIFSNRNGLVFCYKHKNQIEITKRKSLFQRSFVLFYEKFVFTRMVKFAIILFTIVMTGFSLQAVFKLEQKFDPIWFIPDDTYFKKFLDKHIEYYPEQGEFGSVLTGEMNYTKELPNLLEMTRLIRNESYIREFTSWVEGFHLYVKSNFKKDILDSNTTLTDAEFRNYLSIFLFSSTGGRYQNDLRFSQKLNCGEPVGNITGASYTFYFPRFKGPHEYLPAMNNIKGIVKATNITTGDGYRSVWSKAFANWVTDEIIGVEVERNIELALACVMACTVILITNLQMCFWIFLCVLLTLVNVCGWMQRWGMTVDIVSCIGLELAIGLCVDYAAHVAHTFLTLTSGTRSERSLKTTSTIGTAVLYGGGSTLLSLCVLSMSKAYTFKAFFKIFLLVIIFGLFHGLLFLPVVLSLVGPRGYHMKKEVINDKSTEAESVLLNGKQIPNSDDIIVRPLGSVVNDT